MTVQLAWPFTGRWETRNSPADRVPSHGTDQFGTTYAIYFVPVDDAGVSARYGVGTFFRPESPERFAGFGRPVLAPAQGTVVAAHDGEPDHAAYRGLPSIGYALTQHRRAAQGWVGLGGNHVLIETGGVFLALCHLHRGSVAVGEGQQVTVGQPVGRCGNSGNSMEPHLHLQAMDDPRPDRARGLPMTFPGGLPRNGEIVSA